MGRIACSIGRTFALLGDPWTPLILRDVFLGIARFDDLAEDLGVSRKVLAARLRKLVDVELLTKSVYQQHPVRVDYGLTESGRELVVLLLAVMDWGDRWRAGPQGPPTVLSHRDHVCNAGVMCKSCGEAIVLDEVVAHRGPGGRVGDGTRLIGTRLAAPFGGRSTRRRTRTSH